MKHLDQLLSAFNIFSIVSAANCRSRLCLLGETMVTTLIQLLGSKTQLSKVKVCEKRIKKLLNHVAVSVSLTGPGHSVSSYSDGFASSTGSF